VSVSDAMDPDALTALLASKQLSGAQLDLTCKDSPAWLRWSPLHVAAKDNFACAELLVDAGASPNVRTADNVSRRRSAAACEPSRFWH